MRMNLVRSFKGQILTISNNLVQIDCIWITSSFQDESGPTIIFCNPNAGYYQYANFTTQWVQTYFLTGINIMLWNYRGYGRSKSFPDISALKSDGEAVVNFVRTTKCPSKLGVHGQSLGGCIATHLAKNCQLDFLFADRTFSSLTTTVRMNFGQLAQLCIKAFLSSDSNSASDFLDASCYKVVSADPNDQMISDPASLKTGIALKVSAGGLTMNQLVRLKGSEEFSHIWSVSQVKKLMNSLNKVFQTVRNRNKPGLLESDEGYQLVESEQDAVNLSIEVLERVQSLIVGGMRLDQACENKEPVLSVYVWLYVLETWTPSSFGKTLLDVIFDLNKLLYDFQQVEKLSSQVKEIVSLLEILQDQLSKSKESLFNVGEILPLACGHNACMFPNEKFTFIQHLRRAGFVRNQYNLFL